MKYLHTFTVQREREWSRFPIDMLRYDGCHPATEADSGRIEGAADWRLLEPIMLVARKDAKQWTPTDARWRSFGWKVTEHSTRRI